MWHDDALEVLDLRESINLESALGGVTEEHVIYLSLSPPNRSRGESAETTSQLGREALRPRFQGEWGASLRRAEYVDRALQLARFQITLPVAARGRQRWWQRAPMRDKKSKGKQTC